MTNIEKSADRIVDIAKGLDDLARARLVDMETREVSVIDAAANLRTFLVAKAADIDGDVMARLLADVAARLAKAIQSVKDAGPEGLDMLREAITDANETLVGAVQALRSAPTKKQETMKKTPSPWAHHDLAEEVMKNDSNLLRRITTAKADDARALLRGILADPLQLEQIRTEAIDIRSGDLSEAVGVLARVEQAIALHLSEIADRNKLRAKLGLPAEAA
ncbi:MAG: hypothetical protein R3B72_05910 [Polyangiaceae bacterium]